MLRSPAVVALLISFFAAHAAIAEVSETEKPEKPEVEQGASSGPATEEPETQNPEKQNPSTPFYTEIDHPAYAGLSLGYPSAGFALIPFNLTQGADIGNALSYRPATNLQFDVQARYLLLGGNITFHLPQIFPFQAQEGESHFQMYQVNYYGESFGVELSYSKISGFLIENSDSLAPSTLNGRTYYLLPQLENLGIGANFYYVFSPDIYSLSAAFDQGKRQLRPAGSFLLNFGIRYQKLSSPGPIIPTEKQAAFSLDGTLSGLTTATLTLGGGYGFQLALNNLFLSTAILAGAGPQMVLMTTASQSETRYAPALHLNGHFSLGWNANSFLVGAAALLDGYTADTQQIALVHLGAEAKLFCGVRF